MKIVNGSSVRLETLNQSINSNYQYFLNKINWFHHPNLLPLQNQYRWKSRHLRYFLQFFSPIHWHTCMTRQKSSPMSQLYLRWKFIHFLLKCGFRFIFRIDLINRAISLLPFFRVYMNLGKIFLIRLTLRISQFFSLQKLRLTTDIFYRNQTCWLVSKACFEILVHKAGRVKKIPVAPIQDLHNSILFSFTCGIWEQ